MYFSETFNIPVIIVGMHIFCCMEKIATLLMWSGREVTQAILVLGNLALKSEISEELNRIVYALFRVCAKQDREENGSRHLRYTYCLYCTYKALFL